MAVARIDNDRDLVDACTDKLVVRQKTASYSNIYMLNAEKSLKKLESTKRSSVLFRGMQFTQSFFKF
jgi:hypothetical protein